MYCENCGRWLEDGKKCNCKKMQKRAAKKLKKGINWKAVFSCLLFASYVIALWILLRNDALTFENNAKDIKVYALHIISMILCLAGLVIGVFAVKKRTWKILSYATIIGNILGIMISVFLICLPLIEKIKDEKNSSESCK